MTLLLPLEVELPIPAWGFGLIAFGLLVVALLYVLHIGATRPHSLSSENDQHHH